MSLVRFELHDVRDAASVMQAAECLEDRTPFALIFDGTKVCFVPEEMAPPGVFSAMVSALTRSRAELQ